MCSWAWGSESKLRLLRWRYEDRCDWRLVIGGLVSDQTKNLAWDPLGAVPKKTVLSAPAGASAQNDCLLGPGCRVHRRALPDRRRPRYSTLSGRRSQLRGVSVWDDTHETPQLNLRQHTDALARAN